MTYQTIIVDDNVETLDTMKMVFKPTPYPITTVADPVMAYAMIEKNHYDIAILDIQMPYMDGLTLLKKIKNFNGMIQVIMVTGHITIHNALDAMRYGAIDILKKPLEDIHQVVLAVGYAAERLDKFNAILNGLARDGESHAR